MWPMPRTDSVKGSWRVRRVLYHRCRRGDPQAITTLLYRLVDRLYTAASFVAPDEPAAYMALTLTWADLLELLLHPHVGGRLQDRAFELLTGRLQDYADRATVRRQIRNAERESEEGLVALPEEQLQPLVDMVPTYAPDIAANFRARQAFHHRGLYALGTILLLAMLAQVWMAQAMAPRLDLKLTCLQQRIERRELIESLRECRTDLGDPQGADRLQARALERTSLVLEELANARSFSQSRNLPYLVARVRQEALADELAELASAYDGAARRDLLHAQLVLEEVQNL